MLGMAEIRRWLRTRSAREARRRAMEVLVRVEDVYAVLRSERPFRPARDVALALLERALDTNSGMPESFAQNDRLLRNARGVLRRTGDGDMSVGEIRLDGLGPDDDGSAETVVTPDEALHVLRGERPQGEENRIAIAILEAIARMTRGRLKDTAGGTRDLDAALSALTAVREGANPELVS